MRSEHAVDQYIADCEYRQLSPHTLKGYVWGLKRLEDTYEELPTTPDKIKGLIADPALSATSRHDLWRVYHTFYRWVEREGIGPDPTVVMDAPRVRGRFPRTLSVEEIGRLFEWAGGRRERAMIAVLLDTGMRSAELASMTWPSVMEEGVEVFGKTGSRFLPISQHSKKLIVGLGDGHHIWTGRKGPLTVNGLQQAVRRAMHRAGILPPKIGPHTLRHTFGRLYILNGGDVFSLQRLMGHSSIMSTRIYIQMSDRDLIGQHAKFNPLEHLDIPVLKGA